MSELEKGKSFSIFLLAIPRSVINFYGREFPNVHILYIIRALPYIPPAPFEKR